MAETSACADVTEPTEGMVYAGAMIIADCYDMAAPDVARRIFRAMMKAKMIQDAIAKDAYSNQKSVRAIGAVDPASVRVS